MHGLANSCMEKLKNIFAIMILGEFLSYVSTLHCTSIVSSCPTTKNEWQRKQLELGCGRKRYTCILDMDKNLVEACMWNARIKGEMVGCPFIAHCDFINGPILISEDKYFPCPQHKGGCPESNHSGYTISEMHKYPTCYTIAPSQNSDRHLTSHKHYNMTTQAAVIDTEDEKNFPFYVIVIIIIFLIICLGLFFFIYLRYRRNKKEHPRQDQIESSQKFMNGFHT